MRPLARWAIVLLLGLLASLGLPAGARASVDIDAIVGFTDTFRPGHWTPLIVTVGNRGHDLRGELDVQVTADDVARGRLLVTHHRRSLDLHRDSRKSVQFVVFPQALSHPLVITVHAGGREVARADIDLRTRFAPQRLVLVLSRQADLDYLNDASVDGLRVLYPHPELLPTHWRGYDAVSAIVLHGVALERLSAVQFDALHKWIAQGGVLALSGGPDYGLLKTGRVASLLPGVPTGMAAVDPDALRQAFSPSLDVSAPVHVNRLDSVQGEIRLQAAGAPLVVERPLGRGRVVYLTFDVARHPFQRWEGMRSLWLETLRLPPGAPVRPIEESGGNPLAALIAADATPFPSYATAFLFVALYLGLLLAGYATRMRPSSRRWLLPLGGLTAAALLSPIAWLLFGPAAFPGGATVATVALIEPFQDSGYARLRMELGMYATRSGALRLEYRGAEPVLYPHRQAQREGKVEDWVFHEGPRPFVQPLDRRRYVLHALEGDDVIAFQLEAAVLDGVRGLKLVLHNTTGRGLEDSWLLFDGSAYAIGSIPAGARLERKLESRREGVPVTESAWRSLLDPSTGLRAHPLPAQILLERKSQAAGESGYPRAGHALLVGYTASPLRPAGASAEWPRRERALVAYEFAAAPQRGMHGRKENAPRAQAERMHPREAGRALEDE